MSSNVMFSSCSPIWAFAAGVKIGSGSCSLSTRPAGSGTPHTEEVARYSLSAEPVMYPRATHSMGYMRSWRQIIARPATCSGTSRETTWLGTTSSSWSNHHRLMAVRILPLSGMVVGST